MMTVIRNTISAIAYVKQCNSVLWNYAIDNKCWNWQMDTVFWPYEMNNAFWNREMDYDYCEI